MENLENENTTENQNYEENKNLVNTEEKKEITEADIDKPSEAEINKDECK